MPEQGSIIIKSATKKAGSLNSARPFLLHDFNIVATYVLVLLLDNVTKPTKESAMSLVLDWHLGYNQFTTTIM